MPSHNGLDFLNLADAIYEIYDGNGEIKPLQYRSAMMLTSLEPKSAKQIQTALDTSYGTTRNLLSYLLDKEFLEVARKTRGGKEWYARTYKDAITIVFDQLYGYVEKKMSEKGIARADMEMVEEHCNLIFKAIFKRIESAPLELRWKALAIAGLDLVVEKQVSSSYGLPRLCVCLDPAISRKCEQCSLKSYSIDYALSRHFNPFSKMNAMPVSREVEAIKKLIEPAPSREVIEQARDLKRDFGLLWDCAGLFYSGDELFLNGELNIDAYESKILLSFRKIIAPI